MEKKIILYQEFKNLTLDERAEEILRYFYPDYKTEMTAKQYVNAMEALKSIQQ